jgi:cell division septal protein FtsQ
VSDDARERWRREHRRQRKRAPKVAAARRVAAALALVLTISFAALGLLVAWGWGIAAFAALYFFLRLNGVRPFEGGGAEGGTDGYVP